MPGSTMWPAASITRAPAGAASPGPTPAMRSPSIRTSARESVAGVPARTCPPRISRAVESIESSGGPWRALLPRRQQIVGVDLLQPDLALQLEVLGVEIAGLLELGGVELADRHLAALDLARVHEARAHLGGADRAVRIHLGVRLDHVAHALVPVLVAEGVIRALQSRAQEGLEALGVVRDGVFPGH